MAAVRKCDSLRPEQLHLPVRAAEGKGARHLPIALDDAVARDHARLGVCVQRIAHHTRKARVAEQEEGEEDGGEDRLEREDQPRVARGGELLLNALDDEADARAENAEEQRRRRPSRDSPTSRLYLSVSRLARAMRLRNASPSTRNAVRKRKALSVSGCSSRRQMAVRQLETPQKPVASTSIISAFLCLSMAMLLQITRTDRESARYQYYDKEMCFKYQSE